MRDKPWLEHYDEGVPPSIEYPDMLLQDFLKQAAAKYPERSCSIFSGAQLSYAEVDQRSDELAAALFELGIKKGQRVGLFMPNTPQFLISYFALLKIGAVVVAINPLYTAREIEYQVNDAGVEVMLLMTNNYAKIKELQPRTRIQLIIASNIKEALPPLKKLLFALFRERKLGFRVDLARGDIWLEDLLERFAGAQPPPLEIAPDDTALLQYSGGTTGISKGVLASHRNLVANTYQIDEWNVLGHEAEETVMMALPLYHAYGMVVGMLYGLKLAAQLVMVPDPRDISNLLKEIQQHRTTIFPGVPALYNAINQHPDVRAGKYDLSSVSVCISGSAPLLSRTKQRFEELTGGHLVEGYGLSEAPVASHCNPILGENRPGSIGLPLPDVDCRIVSMEDGVTVLGPEEAGELVIQAPQVMAGYHNRPQDSMAALKDGWLYTGDIARMDADGFFYLVGRKKEVIKVGGFQVWPREVEEVIQQHAGVAEVAVAGVDGPGGEEVVAAWIVPAPKQQVDAEQIREWCRQSLAAYKVPRQIYFIDELAKSAVGKVLRDRLVQPLEQNKD